MTDNRMPVRVPRLLVGTLAAIAVLMGIAPTTTAATATTLTYDGPTIARVDVRRVSGSDAAEAQLAAAREASASPSVEAQGTSTTFIDVQNATEAESELGLVCHSFDPRTEVVMADGGRKQIADVQVGDRVRTTDPATGKTVVRTVTALHRNHDTDLADLVVRDGHGNESILHTTEHHRFWDDTRHDWVEAAALTPGHRLHTDDGGLATVESVHTFDRQQWMFDLTVDDVHTYYVVVGEEPVLVHNCGEGALEWATRVEKLDHIFVDKHNLGPLVEQFGSREAVVEQMLNGVQGLTPASGVFEIPVSIGGQTVVVRGAVVDGVTRLGTAFTP